MVVWRPIIDSLKFSLITAHSGILTFSERIYTLIALQGLTSRNKAILRDN